MCIFRSRQRKHIFGCITFGCGELEGLDITRKSLLLPTKMGTVFLIPMPVYQRLYRSLEDSATPVGSSDFEHDIRCCLVKSGGLAIVAFSNRCFLSKLVPRPCSVLVDLMIYDMGVSKNKGTLKWMVYSGKAY